MLELLKPIPTEVLEPLLDKYIAEMDNNFPLWRDIDFESWEEGD